MELSGSKGDKALANAILDDNREYSESCDSLAVPSSDWFGRA